MSNTIEARTHFTDLPNEIVLIIWKYLTHVETMRSFGSIRCHRYIRLLEDYCYKSIDFYTTTFSTFQLCCTQLLDQFRFNVKIFKLGHQNSYSQLRLFSRYCLSSSSLIDIFPQLEELVLRNVHDSDVNDLLPYLLSISFIDKLTLYNCSLKKASKLICESLLNNYSTRSRLISCIMHSKNQRDGLFLSEQLPLSYQPQYSLTYLQIDVRDLATLKYLLICLPNILTLDFHLGVDVKQSDEELFPVLFNPCSSLTKLIIRLRNMVVLNFMAIVKFIRLFETSLQTLHLALIHQDPKFKHSLTYIDGYHLFNEIVIHMKMMKDFSFWIETVCLCDQQMNNIIHSFQTEYWLTMHIGCYYDTINKVYVIFSLPYKFDLRFMIMNDIIHTHFNQFDDHLNCLIPMLYMKMPDVSILIGENEFLSSLFLKMVNQGLRRRKSIRIKSDGIYKMECNNDILTQFDHLDIRKGYENQSSDVLVNTTVSWLSWMPHLRILNIDSELLSQLFNNNFKIDQFSFLELLIIRESNNSHRNELLTIVNHLGRSFSLHTISLQQYKINSQLTINDFYLLLHEVSHNLHRLKLMTIEFHQDNLFDTEILQQLTDIQQKNCYLDYIHCTKTYIELCFSK